MLHYPERNSTFRDSKYGEGVIGIVYSVEDPAGSGIAEYLRKLLKCREVSIPGSMASWAVEDGNAVLVGFRGDVTHFDFLDDVLSGVSSYLVLSLHRASSGVKSLTVHHAGNPTVTAEAGGRPGELSVAQPILAYAMLRNLNRLASDSLKEFQVVYEVTHHGPTNLRKPLTFVEIGSSEYEWHLKEAHEIVGESVANTLRDVRSLVECNPSVGFGGPHYAEWFTRRALKYNECYGHIISRYVIKELSTNEGELREIVRLAATKSDPPATKAVISKVGATPRSIILEALRSLDLRYEVVD